MSPPNGWNVDAEPFQPVNLLQLFNIEDNFDNNIQDNFDNNIQDNLDNNIQDNFDNDPNNDWFYEQPVIQNGLLVIDIEGIEDIEDDFDYDGFLQNIDLGNMGFEPQRPPEMVRQFAN